MITLAYLLQAPIVEESWIVKLLEGKLIETAAVLVVVVLFLRRQKESDRVLERLANSQSQLATAVTGLSVKVDTVHQAVSKNGNVAEVSG